MSRASYAIALDVGGTSIKSGVVAVNTAAVKHHTITPIDSKGPAESILSTIAGVVRRHVQEPETTPLFGVALAFPGPFDYDAGVCRINGVEKYESLFNINVGDELRDRINIEACPIRFRNDAEAAIVGECLYGAGQGYTRVIGVTLGTGFGSAFMLRGVPQASGEGVPPNGWLYPYPVQYVRADDYFSVRGLEQRLKEASGLPVDPKAAAAVARRGDNVGGKVFSAYGTALGSFLSPFIADFRAEAVIVLGGIAEAFDLFGPSLREVVSIPVLPNTMGLDAAMLGAVQLLTGSVTE